MALPQLHPFRPRLLDAVRGYSGTQLRADIAAGLSRRRLRAAGSRRTPSATLC